MQPGYPPGPPMAQGYPPQGYPQGYPPPQGYPQGYPPPQGYPMHPGYPSPHGAPINIVVQNAATMGVGAGGLVRVGNKSRLTAALICFFLGGLGAHKFYLGQTGMGLVYLFFSWTLIPGFIAFIEFILLLIQSDREFDLKYNAALAR